MRRLRRIGTLLLLVAACSSTRGRPPGLGSAPSTAAAPPPGTLAPEELDRLVEASWRAASVTPSPPASDGEFLRRASLDLVGRVPTLPEAKAFLADGRPDKRARLVDALLGSPEFGEHWADVYSDLLWRLEGKNRVEKQADPRAFLVRAFNENWRYDRLSWELLTATGDLRENGALAFIAARAKAGGAEAVTGAAARVFLGLQIQCAQCHDHPYDTRWKQEDFWGLVAYFARTKARQEKSMAMEGGRTFVVFDAPKGQARMRRPGSTDEVVVQPRFLGHRPSELPADTRRRTLARAVLASDLFAKAMVGRTWAQLFGHGLVDPWDDLGAENDARHPALLVKLAEDFRASGFEVKHLLRRIVLSTAYARGAGPAPGAPDDPRKAEAAVRVFARAGIRPLSPEQLFRTLVVATGAEDMVRRRARNDDERAGKLMAQALREYRFAFDDDEMAEANSFDGSMPQALLLLNGELTSAGARAAADGVLGGILRASGDPGARLEDMMLAAYARRPTPEEKALFLAHLTEASSRDPRRAYEDIYFALLNSTEAVTNH